MVATEVITDEKIQELSLPEDLVPVYRDAFSLVQSVSRSISAAAGDIDLFLSVKKSWNRYIRIEQRNKLSKKFVSLRKKLKTAREQLDSKVNKLKSE